MSFLGWLQHEQHDIIQYLREENRVLRAQLQNQRVRLTNDDRRRLAVRGAALGRRRLAEMVTIVTPDTILRWHVNSSLESGRIRGIVSSGRARCRRFVG